MTRSRHTEPPKVMARYGVERRPDGSVVPPRVVYRKPRPGDRHPISKRMLQALVAAVPIKYTYGLSRVEMRARENTVGNPFALYRLRERYIIIYSVPLVWHLSPDSWVAGMPARLAAIVKEDSGVTITWNDTDNLQEWFVRVVFFHELGHHFAHQYRHKRGRIKGRRYNEFSAILKGMHIDRWYLQAIERVWQQRERERKGR